MSNKILANISVGELIDKITILEIKLSNTRDPDKLNNIKRELNELNQLNKFDSLGIQTLAKQLKNVNENLWQIEDDIRILERQKQFDEKFIELARNVYLYNDTRADLKRQINLLTDSYIVEEKIFS